MTDQTRSTNMRIIFTLTMVHFMGDFYSAFTTPLYPAFVEKLNLTMTQVGIIAGINRFLAFIVQPTVGYLADRHQGRFYILGGFFLLAVFVPLSGAATSMWMLILFISIGSVGSSMFHPSVAGMIPLYSGKHKSFSMSVFNTGGTFAFAVGPLFITWFVAGYGLSAMPWTMMIGIFALVFFYFNVPRPISEGMGKNGFVGTLKENFGPVWKTIVLIWLVMVIRAVVGQSFLTFMPLLYVSEGFSLVSAGMTVSVFTIAGTLSGLCAGYFSDRMGFKPIFIVSHLLMTPALLLLMHLKGAWIYTGVFLAGFFVLASMPLGVAFAQELAPKGRSMVSSLMMGLAYGLGGALAPVVGKLADIYSIRQVLFMLSFLPLITLFIIFLFPGNKKRV